MTLALSSVALASETNNGNPEYSSQANTVNSSYQDSVMLDGNKGLGSGALYDVVAYKTAGGKNAISLNIATADHVVRPNTGAYIDVGLHFGTGTFTLNSTNSTESYQLRGPGSYQLNEDLAYVGVTITQDQTDAETWTFLNSLTSQNPTLGQGGGSGSKLTNYGYGVSGKYLVDDFNVATGTHTEVALDTFTPGAQANGHVFTGKGFESEDDFGNQYNSGIDRLTTTTSVGVFDYASTNYQYNAMEWIMQDQAGFGQINSGDSGGAILSGGKIVGLNTFAVGSTYTLANGTINGEDFYYGSLGGGIAFTGDDIKWLNGLVPAPEPASLLGLAALAIGAVSRRRLKK